MKTILGVLMLSLILVSAPFADTTQLSAKPAAAMPSKITDKATGMEFILVKGGCYQMGDFVGDGEKDEKPVHEACVKDFFLGKYEVTQGQWQRVMGGNPSYFPQCGADCPVDYVSWEMAQAFIARLNGMSKLQYRLPTEAEWEYAARSGGKVEKWAGTSDETLLEQYAWYAKNSENTIHKVGQKKPNGLGLFDMSGNVREWCQDLYDNGYYGKSPKANPVANEAVEAEGRRAQRGGDWWREARGVRSTLRSANVPDLQGEQFGFRLLLPAN